MNRARHLLAVASIDVRLELLEQYRRVKGSIRFEDNCSKKRVAVKMTQFKRLAISGFLYLNVVLILMNKMMFH